MTFREKLDQLLLDAYKEVAGIHYNEGAVDSPEQEAKEWLLTNGQNFKRAIIQAILDELPEDIEPKRGRDSLSPLDIMHNLTLEELRKKFSNE